MHVRDICFWLEPGMAADSLEDFNATFADLVRRICSSSGVDSVDVTLFDEGYVDPGTGRVARGYHLKMSASQAAFPRVVANSLVNHLCAHMRNQPLRATLHKSGRLQDVCIKVCQFC